MYKKSILSYIRQFAISLLLLLTACGSLKASGKQEKVQPTLTSTAEVNPSVTVHDQDSDGTSVIVADVVSQGSGWVAIHNQVNGKMGDPIGETQLNPGDNKNIVVKIDPARATPVMYAMLHDDAGTVGKYEFPGPDVPVMVNDQMLAPAFNVNLLPVAVNTLPVAMNTPTAEMSQMSITTPSPTSTDLSVMVSDQALTGDTVMVDEVTSSEPGWIVIYTIDSYGQPDQPIGHAAVNAGINLMVAVPVDPAKAQGTLYAQLHVDTGMSGTFEYPGVDAPVMEGLKMIASPFQITSQPAPIATATMVMTTTPITTETPVANAVVVALQPSVIVSDQAVLSGTVTIAQVVSNGNWWLVIHRQNSNGAMGEYIGQTLIKNGINTNVVVKINMDQATPVLYAMLHEDHDPIGVLQFPGPDVPVMVDGQMVVLSFNVTGLAQDITIRIRKISDTISFLTDGEGNSLYITTRDTPGKSNCSVDCRKVWKPLLANGSILPGEGVAAQNLGVILLPDGTRQITYLGAPLYYYSKDDNPGDTNGQGVDGVWFLVAP